MKKYFIIVIVVALCSFVTISCSGTVSSPNPSEYSPETSASTSPTPPSIDMDEIKTAIEINDVVVSAPNSANGVDLVIYYKNLSEKEIKYITFVVTPYNAVNDPVTDEITSDSSLNFRITGPVSKLGSLDDIKKMSNPYYYYDKKVGSWLQVQSMNDILGNIAQDDVNLGNDSIGYFPDPSQWAGWIELSEDDLSSIVSCGFFENAWYNSTIEYAKVYSANIEYMDGSSLFIPHEAIESVSFY